MTKQQRIAIFSELGTYLRTLDAKSVPDLQTVVTKNPWYTTTYVQKQLDTFARNLTLEKLTAWTALVPDNDSPKTVALILAGNIPLVGFHDILSVLISGYRVQIKVSSDDAGLTPFILEQLLNIAPEMASRIALVERLRDYDLVIATGSNNSSRYFDYYFSDKPHIIRKNRNAVAVLSGKESAAELEALGHDIFDFFGMGCRSVSKVYMPENYSVATLLDGLESFAPIGSHAKYANNYDYYKSIFLINGDAHFDNGFMLLKEDPAFASPLAVVHTERYADLDAVARDIRSNASAIQCVVSALPLSVEVPLFPFGQSQSPELDDYADGVDTLAFLAEHHA